MTAPTVPLPEPGQPLLLEASAGTGKTWQVADLVLRLVAEEGVPLSAILLVTYTNAATAELRDRVRRRLDAARAAVAGAAGDRPDATLAGLSQWPNAKAGLDQALARFDDLFVSTIHGFCQRTLVEHATSAGFVPPREVIPTAEAFARPALFEPRTVAARWPDPGRFELLARLGWRGPSNLPAHAATVCGAMLAPSPAEVAEVPAPAGDATRTGRLTPDRAADEAEDLVRGLLRDLAGHRATIEAALAAGAAGDARPVPDPSAPTAEVAAFVAALYERRRADPGALSAIEPRLARFDAAWDALARRLFASLATGLRARVRSAMADAGVLTYDEMLARLDEALDGEDGGPLGRALRQRLRVAIVDEFQDTDPTQWSILRKLFVHPDARLVLVGDPKQSIYRFRGADIHTYARAAAAPGVRKVPLTRNFRSDGPLLAGLEHLFGPGTGAFMSDDFDFVSVEAAPGREAFGLEGAPPVTTADGPRPRRPFELRLVTTAEGAAGVAAVRERLCEACAAEVAALLAAGTRLAGEADGTRPLRASDVAVLVYDHRQAARMEAALAARGIRCVRPATASVFGSDAARWLRDVVFACADREGTAALHRIALGPFGGLTHEEAAVLSGDLEPDDPAAPTARRKLDALLAALDHLRATWRRRGFGPAVEAFWARTQALEAIATLEHGDRHVTDLRHLVELCHAEQRRGFLSPEGLARFLDAAIREASTSGAVRPAAGDPTLLRLDSDEDAVSIVTVWGSKGLTFEVTFVPFAGLRTVAPGKPNELVAGFDPRRGRRVLAPARPVAFDAIDGAEAPATDLTRRVLQAEEDDAFREEIRLLYVALTRARHHVVLFAPDALDMRGGGRRPLLHLLGRPRNARGAVAVDRGSFGATDHLPADRDALAARLAHLADTSNGTVGFAEVPSDRDLSQGPQPSHRRQAAAPIARRPIDPPRFVRDFQVASFSAWAAGGVADPEEPAAPEERALEAALEHDAPESDGPRAPVPDAAVPASPPAAEGPPPSFEGVAPGRHTGTAIHELLERLDFPTGLLDDGRRPAAFLAARFARAGLDPAAAAVVERDLAAVLQTPLDNARLPIPPGWCLARIDREDRLDELVFDLAMGAGTAYRRGTTAAVRIDTAGVRAALAHRLETDPNWEGAAWLAPLVERGLPDVAGILTGSIDLLFRLRDGATTRTFVVDYKTNRLCFGAAPHDGEAYDAPHLAHAMADHHYHLQGLLYTLAAHRFLRDQLGADYDYDRHFGGHMYLFLRGMSGPDTPRTGPAGACRGVYADRWPRAVIEALDRAFGAGCLTSGGPP